MFLPNPGILAAGAGRTYDDWLAHIITRTNASVRWDQRTDFWPYDPGGIRIGPASAAFTGNTMFGSPWSSRGFSQISPPGAAISARVVQHSLPSEAVYNAIIGAEGVVLLRTEERYEGLNFQSLNRNGLVSSSGSNTTGYSMHVVECSYWNPQTNKPETLNPDQQSGPVPYAYAGW